MTARINSGIDYGVLSGLKVAIMFQNGKHGLIRHKGGSSDAIWWVHEVSTLNIEDGHFYGVGVAYGFDGDEIEHEFDVSDGDVLLPCSGSKDKDDNKLYLGDVVGVNGMLGNFTVIFNFGAFLLRHNSDDYEDKPLGFIASHNLTKIGSIYD